MLQRAARAGIRLASNSSRHRVSVQRRLAAARDRLRERTRVVLTQRLGLSAAEMSTLIRSLLRRFDVTLSRLLREPSEPER